MKHTFLFMAMLLASVFAGNAQSTLVATLSHDGAVTTYAGNSGLQDAYQDAVDGDVITLSAGSFRAQNIEKRITLRGAGMGVKVNASAPYFEPTCLVGSFEIIADGNSENRLKVEGIVCEEEVRLGGVTDALFTKCKFDKLNCISNKGGFSNVTFINCVLWNGNSCDNASMYFYGCYLKDCVLKSSGSLHNMINCVLEVDYQVYWHYEECVVKNSIFYHKKVTAQRYSGPSAQSYYSLYSSPDNCSDNCSFYMTLESHNNSIAPKEMVLFIEGTFFQLTDEAKQYVGDDGTEIGIYGGSLPFDPTPTNPQITRFNVAPKTTADGKLSIDIEVNAK